MTEEQMQLIALAITLTLAVIALSVALWSALRVRKLTRRPTVKWEFRTSKAELVRLREIAKQHARGLGPR